MIDRSLFTLPGAGMMLGILLIMGIIQALCVLGQTYGLAGAISNLWAGAVLADQYGLIALFLACFLAKQLVVFVQENILDRYSRARAKELRENLLSGVFETQAHIVRQAGSARVSSSALEGIDQIETYLRVILPKIINVVAIPFVLLVALFIYDWISAIILLVLFPVIIFYMILLGRMASARAEAQYATYNQMSNHFIDTLRGLDTLKAFGASRAYAKSIFNVSERFRIATIDTLKVATLSSAVLDLIATVGVAAVAMLLGFRLLNDQMALFNGLAVLVLAPEYFKPIREFASDFHASLDGKNALADISKLITLAHDDRAQRTHDIVAPWSESSTLTLRDVSFSYPRIEQNIPEPTPEENEVLSDTTQEDILTNPIRALDTINLTIHGTAKIGIVGASGSGKTTLAGLLGGFNLVDEGSIEIDGAPIASLRCDGWQSQVLYIPQDPYIFHATLRDNICFYTPQATEESVLEAVHAVGLDSLVAELPHGLDTVIGEGARGLSGGQAQRIALARALLDSSRRILIFDEPTAHLDIETELELKQRMLPLMQERLVLFATHRLHWLSSMDWIVVMQNGHIAEQGTLNELLERDGVLNRLVARVKGGKAS